MFFQNSIGIDVQKDAIRLAWLRGTVNGFECRALAVFRNEDDSKEWGLADIDTHISGFVRKHQIDRFDLYLGIPEENCLLKNIEFPAAVKDEIDSVIPYEIEKYIPISSSKVVYGYRVNGPGRARDSMSVDLYVVKRDDLKPFLEIKDFITGGVSAIVPARSALQAYERHIASGRRPRMKEPSDDHPAGTSSPEFSNAVALASGLFLNRKATLNFLPEHYRKKPSRSPVICFWVLLALFFVGLTAISASYVIQQNHQIRELNTRLSLLKNQVVEVDALERRTRILTAQRDEIRHLADASPQIIDMLNEITRILPKDTYLTDLEFKNGHVWMKGNASNASLLIQPLEQSVIFKDVGFNSKITVAQNNKEAFIIKMAYELKNELKKDDK